MTTNKYMRYSSSTGLFDTDILNIRKEHANGTSVTNIADDYGIGKTTVKDIVSMRSWGHVPAPQTIKGINGYEVYADGRVYSIKSKKFLTARQSKSAGLVVDIMLDGRKQAVNVATLVARAYHNGKPKSKINYIDGDATNVHHRNIAI